MGTRNAFPDANTDSTWSVFDTASRTFALLVAEPHSLSIDGRDFARLPDRHLPLDEVGRILLRRGCSRTTQDAVWAYLVRRSRTDGASWTVACVGLALPGLITMSARLVASFTGDHADIHSAVLAGFLAELTVIDLREPWILPRLRNAAREAGKVALRELMKAPNLTEHGFGSQPPRPQAEHQDLVLARAVADGVITTAQAELISATRVGGESLLAYAARTGRTYEAVKKARQRAEGPLIAYLTDDTSGGEESVEPRRCRPPVARRATPRPRTRRSRTVSSRPGTRAHKSRRFMSRNGPQNPN